MEEKYKNFEDVLRQVIKEKKEKFGDKKVNLSDYPKMIEEILKKFKLKSKEVKYKEARLAVMKGRPCLCIMFLEKNSMKFFNQFFSDKKNEKEIFTKEKFIKKIIQKKINIRAM